MLITRICCDGVTKLTANLKLASGRNTYMTTLREDIHLVDRSELKIDRKARLKIPRQTLPKQDPKERTKNWNEVYTKNLWVAEGELGFAAFGDPVYTTREAWTAFVTARRLRSYR